MLASALISADIAVPGLNDEIHRPGRRMTWPSTDDAQTQPKHNPKAIWRSMYTARSFFSGARSTVYDICRKGQGKRVFSRFPTAAVSRHEFLRNCEIGLHRRGSRQYNIR